MTIDLFCCCRCRCYSHFGAVFVYGLYSTHIVVCSSHVKHVCASLSLLSLHVPSQADVFLFLIFFIVVVWMCASLSICLCVCVFSLQFLQHTLFPYATISYTIPADSRIFLAHFTYVLRLEMRKRKGDRMGDG